jgi:hypothetical protein
MAFQDNPDSVSVALGIVLGDLGLEPDVVVASFPGYGLWRLSVALVRDLGLGVVKDPTESEKWHGSVYGKKTKRVKASLARNGEWVRRPAGPSSQPSTQGPSLVVRELPPES